MTLLDDMQEYLRTHTLCVPGSRIKIKKIIDHFRRLYPEHLDARRCHIVTALEHALADRPECIIAKAPDNYMSVGNLHLKRHRYVRNGKHLSKTPL